MSASVLNMDVSRLSRAAVRRGYVEWMSRPSFTHAVTLAPNRFDHLSFELLTSLFGTFCFEIDRHVLRIKHPNLRRSQDRFEMIAMPEKVGVNPHLHGVANFGPKFMGDRLQGPWQSEIHQIWRTVTRGSGDLQITDSFDKGLLDYFTKEALRRDHVFLHSWFFHRDDKLRKLPKTITNQAIAPRKAA